MDVVRYLGALTRPFFRWWWALITGLATLLSYFTLQATGVSLTAAQAAMGVFGTLTLAFFAVSVMVEGFGWYRQAHRQPTVVSCTPADAESSPEVFQLTSVLPLDPGQVISLLRAVGDRVVCMGMLKVERLIGERYQCVPLWIAAIHRQDLKQGKIQVAHLSASVLLNESDLTRYREEVSA